ARASGVNAKLIRYYESIGLLPAAGRTEAGYRVYSASDVERLRFVKRSRSLGFGMDEIKQLLSLWQDQSRASAEVKQLALSHLQTLEAKLAEIQSMVDVLRKLAAHCHGNEQPDCPILHDLAGQ
ncbi:MAG: Cu(I)-responsive transcriptional regulator, partial [Candidatus Melainabacteria bacterium HGW-Melainabacteria-1]